jgi:hypothetical protein
MKKMPAFAKGVCVEKSVNRQVIGLQNSDRIFVAVFCDRRFFSRPNPSSWYLWQRMENLQPLFSN